jgi:sulfite reductase alpha subunit
MPLCEALEEGPWPSHVTELRKSRYHLQMYEEGLRLRQTQWGFGGYISLPGVAAGILVRASARPDIAGGANFVRVLPPSGGWYSTGTLRALCDVADEHAYGILHLHSSGGDVEILGITTEGLGSAVEALNAQGLDVGSTSDAFRNTVECLGATRCDAVLADAADLREAWYRRFLDDVQYPRFPHKVKVKFSGCPNDCARAQQKSDIGVIGIFRDAPKVDQGRLQEWIGQGGDIHRIVMNCPTKAMEHDGQTLTIDAESCVHCMYCINKCSYAIRPGDDRGVAITVGGKLRGKYGPLMGKVLIPFLPLHSPDYPEIMDAIEKIAAVFDENAKRKERLGDFLFRVGMDQFTKWMGIKPSPRPLGSRRDLSRWRRACGLGYVRAKHSPISTRLFGRSKANASPQRRGSKEKSCPVSVFPRYKRIYLPSSSAITASGSTTKCPAPACSNTWPGLAKPVTPCARPCLPTRG